MKFFSTNMEFLRKSKDLKQAEIQDRLEIDRTTWSNYERGKSFPKLELFHKIAQYFSVSEADLLNVDLSNTTTPVKYRDKKKSNSESPRGSLEVQTTLNEDKETVANLNRLIAIQTKDIEKLNEQLESVRQLRKDCNGELAAVKKVSQKEYGHNKNCK